MKKIIVENNATVNISEVSPGRAIFVKRDNKLCGMVVQESHLGKMYPNYWIVKCGGSFGAYGYYESRKELIEVGIKRGYEFFIED